MCIVIIQYDYIFVVFYRKLVLNIIECVIIIMFYVTIS